MIEHQSCVSDGLGQVAEINILVVVVPGVVTQAKFAQCSQTLPKILAAIQIGQCLQGNGQVFRSCIASASEADALEQITGDLLMSLDDFFEQSRLVTQCQINLGDNSIDGGLLCLLLTLSGDFRNDAGFAK